MDLISLAMLAPVALGLALILLRWLRDRDRLPESLSTRVLFGLVASLGLAVMIGADALWTLAVAPLRAQQALLGQVAAGPGALRSMEQTRLHLTSAASRTQWSFALTPEAEAGLRRRCSDPFLTGDCLLGRMEARRWITSASLAGDRLVIDSGPEE